MCFFPTFFLYTPVKETSINGTVSSNTIKQLPFTQCYRVSKTALRKEKLKSKGEKNRKVKSRSEGAATLPDRYPSTCLTWEAQKYRYSSQQSYSGQ